MVGVEFISGGINGVGSQPIAIECFDRRFQTPGVDWNWCIWCVFGGVGCAAAYISSVGWNGSAMDGRRGF